MKQNTSFPPRMWMHAAASVQCVVYLSIIVFFTTGCKSESNGSTVAIQAAESSAPFSLAFRCEVKPSTKNCLVDSHQKGRDVVLVEQDRSGTCGAKTADSFLYQDEIHSVPATRLTALEGCRGPFYLGIFDATPAAVRLNLSKISPISSFRNLDQKARKLLKNPTDSIYWIAESDPRILATEGAKLLTYKLRSNEKGPSIVFLNEESFELAGWCTTDHMFFSVSGKLYLAYSESGCDSGKYVLYVYGLSNGKAEQIYRNGRLGT